MEYFGNIIAVTMHELTRSDDGEAVMSRSAYDHLVTRGRVNVLRPGKGLGSYALIEYHSLPERFRLRFEAKYGNPEKIMKQEDMPLAVDSEAQKYYHEYLCRTANIYRRINKQNTR